MDAIINLPEFLWEFLSRRDFLGAYLSLIALNLLWFAARGIFSQRTRGFGSQAAVVTGTRALEAAMYWAAIGIGLFAFGVYLWSSAA